MLSTLQTYCCIRGSDCLLETHPGPQHKERDGDTYIVSDRLLNCKSFIVDIFRISDGEDSVWCGALS